MSGISILYSNLVAQAKTETTGVKYVTMWNNQVDRMHEAKVKLLDSRKPAVFFEFIPGEPEIVGGGVVTYPFFKIRAHIVSEMFSDMDEMNLQAFDTDALVHAALNEYVFHDSVNKCGLSPLSLSSWEIDHDHDNVYHSIREYATCWTDNTTRTPRGGYEVDPNFNADFSFTKLTPDTANITVSVSDIPFGNVDVSDSSTKTLTIAATKLTDTLILSVSNPVFLLSLDNVTFKTRLEFPPVDGVVTETTLYAKFTPTAAVSYSSDINYGVPGTNSVITLSGTGV